MAETQVSVWNPWEDKWSPVGLSDAERMLDELRDRIPEARRKERARLQWEIGQLQRRLSEVRE